MFGNILEKNIYMFKNASLNKKSKNAFWIILRDIAVEELKEYSPNEIDSGYATEIYYKILNEHESYLPNHFQEKIKSNNQERYRVINRNLWSSNNNNPNGLCKQSGVCARTEMNEDRSGKKTIYSWQGEKWY